MGGGGKGGGNAAASYRKANDQAYKILANAAEKSNSLLEENHLTNKNMLSPLTDQARESLFKLQNASEFYGQDMLLSDYFNSNLYKQLSDQARYEKLASAAATGGMGSSATSNQLAFIAPQLGQQYLNDYMNNQGNLFSAGMGGVAAVINSGNNYAGNAAANIMNSAGLNANGLLNAGNVTNQQKSSSGKNFLNGALSGAATGLTTTGNPWGALAGGVVGGVGSLL